MKTCTGCKRSLPLQSFYVNRASRDCLAFRCKDCTSAAAKSRYAANPEIAKQRAKKWAKDNHERRAEIRIKSQRKNAAKHKESTRRARERRIAEDIEAVRIGYRLAAFKRRQHGAQPPHPAFVKRLMQRAKCCTYCGVEGEKLTIDHFDPVSKGGSSASWNLVPCCSACNSSKRNSDGPTWMEWKFGIQRLAEVIYRLQDLEAARMP